MAPPTCLSYVQFFAKTHSYRPTPAAQIRASRVSSALKSMGGKSRFSLTDMIYSAGSGTLDGPFLRRIEAEGKTGIHAWLRLNEARVSTAFRKQRERFTRHLTAKIPPHGTS